MALGRANLLFFDLEKTITELKTQLAA